MALGLATRELELIIIAQDGASSAIARIGGALTLLGAGMARMAWEGVQGFREMTQEALDFDKTARLAFTQVSDKANTSLEDVKDIMRDVARATPAPFEELDEALFDIFSSMDANAEEAKRILMEVSRAAVAGQTEVRSAMVPTIAMMNAFDLGAEDINHILDLQFKTVQKGIITYDELTGNIGKTIPAAYAAGQSLETMSGAIAFLTRNGLDAAMASTSVARAFELFADPKAQKGLKAVGVEFKNQHGEFRQITDVLEDLDKVFGEMTAPERKIAFKEIFGTGRIQARRFFDIAIPQWREFQGLVDEFSNSKGAMQEAYDIMLTAPQTQLEQLRNRWQLLREEVGVRFFDALDKVIDLLDRLFDRWDALDDRTKDLIVRWAAYGTVALGLVGILTSLAGTTLLLTYIWKGLATAAGGATILKAVKGLGIWGALLATAGLLIFKNWDRVGPIWDNLVDQLREAWKWLRPLVEEVKEFVKTQWDRVVDEARKAWEKLSPVVQYVADWLRKKWEVISEWWQMELWPRIQNTVIDTFEAIKVVVERVTDIVILIIGTAVDTITWIWENFRGTLEAVWNGLGDNLMSILEGTLDVLRGLILTFTGLLDGDWETMKEGLSLIWQGLWDTIVDLVETNIAVLSALFEDLGALLGPIWEGIWNPIVEFFQGAWDNVVAFFQGGSDRVLEIIKSVWESDILTTLRNIVFIMWHIIRITWENIWNVIRVILGGIKLTFETFWNAIATSAQVIWGGIQTFASQIWQAISTVILEPAKAVWDWISTNLEKWRPLFEKVFGPIKSYLFTIWSGIWGIAVWIWNGIKRAILDPIGSAVTGVRNFFDDIIGFFQGFWQKASEWTTKIRETLSKINPASWFSPPLTKQVMWGMDDLTKNVLGPLKDLNRQVMPLASGIRDQLLFNTTTDATAQINAAPFAERRFNETPPQRSGPLVNIESLTSTADPVDVARRIAWEIVTSGVV